jgi:hypothetical protein
MASMNGQNIKTWRLGLVQLDYETYFVVVVGVKQRPSIATRKLIIKLEIHFPSHEFMDALRVVSLVEISQILATIFATTCV